MAWNNDGGTGFIRRPQGGSGIDHPRLVRAVGLLRGDSQDGTVASPKRRSASYPAAFSSACPEPKRESSGGSTDELLSPVASNYGTLSSTIMSKPTSVWRNFVLIPHERKSPNPGSFRRSRTGRSFTEPSDCGSSATTISPSDTIKKSRWALQSASSRAHPRRKRAQAKQQHRRKKYRVPKAR